MTRSLNNKRKLEEDSTLPNKRNHIQQEDGALTPSLDVLKRGNSGPSASDDAHEYDDLSAAFTLAGTPRAPSEANRLWIYACPYEDCGKRFNRPCRLNTHIRTHTKERPFTCFYDACDKTFTRKDHLERHFIAVHDEGPKLVCDWDGCDKSFTTTARLRRHRESHEASEARKASARFRCKDYPPCNETFRKHSTLQAHINTMHLNVKAFPCTHTDETTSRPCPHAYHTEANLTKHIGRAHGGHRYFCTLCSSERAADDREGLLSLTAEPEGFPTYSALQNHITTAHPPVCNYCGLKCATKATLRAHIEIVHDATPAGVRLFPCTEPDCGRKFTKRGNRSVHIQSVHNKVKRFVCGQFDLTDSASPELRAWVGEGACGQAFAVKSTLEAHIRSQHLRLGSNRKQRRKSAKTAASGPKKKVHVPSTLSQLTGVAEPERLLSCFLQGCTQNYAREHDLRVHLSSAHSWADAQIEEVLAETVALHGGPFWIGGDGGQPLRQSIGDRAFAKEDENARLSSQIGYQSPYTYSDPLIGESLDADEEDKWLDFDMGLEDLDKVNIHDGVLWQQNPCGGFGLVTQNGFLSGMDDSSGINALTMYLRDNGVSSAQKSL